MLELLLQLLRMLRLRMPLRLLRMLWLLLLRLLWLLLRLWLWLLRLRLLLRLLLLLLLLLRMLLQMLLLRMLTAGAGAMAAQDFGGSEAHAQRALGAHLTPPADPG